MIGALLLIAPRPVGDGGEHVGVYEHFREGLRYLRARRVMVLATLAATAFSVFGIAIVQLAEPIARKIFDAGAGKYGLMVSVYGVGALFGSLFAVSKGDSIRRSTLTIVGLVVFVAGILALGVVPAFGAAVGIFTVMGAAQVLCNVSCQTAMQVNVEEQFRARVLSIYVLGFFAGTPIGALLAGVLAQLVGLRETIIVFGAAFGLCVLVLGLRYRWYKPLDQSLPSIHDSHVVAPDNLPLGTDLDTSGHLIIEPLE